MLKIVLIVCRILLGKGQSDSVLLIQDVTISKRILVLIYLKIIDNYWHDWRSSFVSTTQHPPESNCYVNNQKINNKFWLILAGR